MSLHSKMLGVECLFTDNADNAEDASACHVLFWSMSICQMA